jgi:hypothetical protein
MTPGSFHTAKTLSEPCRFIDIAGDARAHVFGAPKCYGCNAILRLLKFFGNVPPSPPSVHAMVNRIADRIHRTIKGEDKDVPQN